MKLYQNRKFLIGAIISSILFTSLMVYRVGFYSGTFRSSASEKVDWSNQSLKSDESWMNIFQNFKKIGFSHRILENMGSSYKIHEKTVMKINTMGMVQDIHVESKSTTDMDFAIKKFDFKISSGSFNFSVKGEIKENTLYVQSNSNNSSSDNSNKNNKPLEIVLENRPYLTSGIIQATLASGLKQNQEMVLFIFDPSTLGQAPATVRMEDREKITLDGKVINSQKVSLSFKGAKQFAWVDNEGKVVKEEGLLGITLLKTDRKGAIEGTPIQDSDDLTNLVSVKANKILNNPSNLKDITVKISGLDDLSNFYTALNSGRQVLTESKDNGAKSGDNGSKSWVLKIEKEQLEGLPQKITSDDLAKIDNKFKQPDAFIQSDDYRIRSFAFKAISSDSGSAFSIYSNSNSSSNMASSSNDYNFANSSLELPLEKVKKLVAWIQKNIKRQPVVSLPNALSTLENRMGDCNEHAALLAAFCRAVGIPAKIEAGLVYLNGSFYYHAWNSLFVGRWITVDALFNQIPADATHIAFSSGSQDMQLDIVGLIGRVQIEILNSN
ncbi:MAG: transglutaminase domain-containing protein [Desulfamplus sp.]|nr:transglutaminase domain-containing protein [Desulfamplus sp.]